MHMKKYILVALAISLFAINASAQQFHFGFGVSIGTPVVVVQQCPPPVIVAPCYQPVVICDPVYRYYYYYCQPVYLGPSFRPVPRQFYSRPPMQAPPRHQYRGGRR